MIPSHKIASILIVLVSFSFSFSQNKEAQFIQQLESSSDKEHIYKYTDSLHLFYNNNGPEDKYIQFSQKTLDLAEELKDYDNYIETSILLSKFYRTSKANYITDDEVLRRAQNYLEYTKDKYLIGRVFFRRAGVFEQNGTLDSAIVYYTKAINAHSNKDSTHIADAIFYRGISHSKKKEYINALEDFKLAKQYYRNLGEQDFVFNVQNSEIMIYSSNGLVEKAIEERKAQIESKIELGENLVSDYYNLANDYRKIEDIKNYNKYLVKSLEYLKTSQYAIYQKPFLYSSLVTMYAKLDDKKNAIKYYNLLNELDYNNSSNSNKVRILRTQARYHLHFGNTKTALEKIKTAIDLTATLNGIELKQSIRYLANQIHQKQGNYQTAMTYFKTYSRVKDSLNSVQKAKTLSYYQTLYEVEQQQQKFDLEKKAQNQVIAEQKKSKKNLWLSFSIILLLLSSIALYIYNSRKKLKQQKVEIEDALEEKKILLKEIHHRVKNNLQIVTSLLNIQAQGIADDKVLKAIKEGQNRVQIMGLLHKSLYQSEQMSNIDVKKYISELLQYLKGAFLGTSNRIEIHLDMNDIHFDFDTAIPLGLIINEVISNAFNHGFSQNDTGNIWVKIIAKNNIDYVLEIHNDGAQLPKDFDINNTNSMGLTLVQSLARQLRGELEINTSLTETRFSIAFKDLKFYKQTVLN